MLFNSELSAIAYQISALSKTLRKVYNKKNDLPQSSTEYITEFHIRIITNGILYKIEFNFSNAESL